MPYWLDVSSWPWEALVAVKIAAGSFLAPFAGRLIGNAPARERIRRIVLQYCWAVALALAIAFGFWGVVPYSSATWGILLVGMLQPFGGFFYLRALAWNASRVPIFFALSTVIPLFLSAELLGEWRVFVGNQVLLAGVVVAVAGVILHFLHDANLKRVGDDPEVPLAFYGYAVMFVLVFGLGMFGWNWWAKSGVSAPELIVFWYAGALFGAVALLAGIHMWAPADRDSATPPAMLNTLIAVMGASIVLNLVFGFLPLQKVEQVVVLPFYSLGDIVGPVIIGMLIFHEWKKIQGLGWFYLAMGHLGGAMIVFSR